MLSHHPCNQLLLCAAPFLLMSTCCRAVQQQHGTTLFTVDPANGSYSLGAEGLEYPVFRADVAAEIDGRWIKCRDYKAFEIKEAQTTSTFGVAQEWAVRCTGLGNQPDLSYQLLSYPGKSFGEVRATVHNTTDRTVHVEAIRVVNSIGPTVLNLSAPSEEDRVLSDSFSEDQPPIKIRDLKDAENLMHRGIGSQLLYNRKSRWSFFAGALSTDRFLTLLHIYLNPRGDISSFEVDSTGTTEITKENSLAESPIQDQLQLSLALSPGSQLCSERLLLGIEQDYHHQLETYGQMVKDLYRARTYAPPVMGWWSWTAYYYGLNEGAALTNARWLSQNLANLGFTMFHLDEGYQYARGEYTTPDAVLFPHGLIPFEQTVHRMGLTRGIWTAPFEVSERSAIFAEHQDWLVHNANGQPIHLGWANNHHDRLYALDTTHPAAQQYLRSTYTTLVKDWGIQYIKLDFMDDSAVEGIRYRPDTTALEAQRIGLDVIRHTVGDNILLDKDGSTMLNPVGYVDYGRIGQDTGHTFTATKETAPAVAARYYMNRNFFVNDPDAFTVSTQTVKDHPWNGGQVPLTLDEAKVSIALSAISGGMFEIGDDLPALARSPERLALIKNIDLINMIQLGRASTPVDLMTFRAEDEQPSVFLLKEDSRHSILTVFNWTEKPAAHTVDFSSLGLSANRNYAVSDVLGIERQTAYRSFSFHQPSHSVRIFKLEDKRSRNPKVELIIEQPSLINSGEVVRFTTRTRTADVAIVRYKWSFGDGTSAEGASVEHTYTQPGVYKLSLKAIDLDSRVTRKTFTVKSVGSISSVFVPERKERLKE